MRGIVKILIGFALIFFVSGFGAVLVDYGLHSYITVKTLAIVAVMACALAAVAKIKFKVPIPIVAGFVIGVIMIPYIQFFIGKMDIYAVDPPEFRESVFATEIRLDMGEFIMKNSEGQEIAVMKDIPTKKLYPGKNEVHVGTLNMPPGTYVSGKMKMERIEVDINIDLDKEIEIQMATVAPLLPSQANVNDIKAKIRSELISAFSPDNFAKMAPAGITFTDIRTEGSKVYFTVVVEPPEIPIPFPMQIPYPTGTGGPDVTIDIILDSMGYPTNIKPIIHLPPGAPEIDIPEIVPDLSKYGAPSSVGPSQSDIDARIQSEMQARAGPGGCLGESECQSYCTDTAHRDECLAYAQSQGISVPTIK